MRHIGIAQLKARFHQLRVCLICVADWCQLFFDVPLLWSLRSWLQEQPSNDDFGANRQFRDALPGNSHCLVTVCLNHQETVPDVEEHPIVPDRTEPWRPLTENEKNAWNALSPEEKEVCDALVHRLHRELGHSDIRGMVDSLRQNRAHPTVLASAKLTHCTACQESARMLSRPVTSGKVMERGAVLQMDIFLLETPLEGGACQRHVVGGCLFKSGCDSDLANCTPLGTSWKCVSVGSKTNATRIVVQVLRTSRNSHDRS